MSLQQACHYVGMDSGETLYGDYGLEIVAVRTIAASCHGTVGTAVRLAFWITLIRTDAYGRRCGVVGGCHPQGRTTRPRGPPSRPRWSSSILADLIVTVGKCAAKCRFVLPSSQPSEHPAWGDISTRYNTPRFSSHYQKLLAFVLSRIIIGNGLPA